MRKIQLKSVLTDNNSRELIDYLDPSFLLGLWTDTYSLMRDHTLDYHWHSDFEFGFLLSGELDYYLSQTHMRLKSGDCIFINSNTLHMAKLASSVNDATMIVITFHPSIFSKSEYTPFYAKYFQGIAKNNIQGCKIERSSQYGDKIIDGLKEIYAVYNKNDYFELLCLSVLCSVWHHTLQYIKHSDPKVIQKSNSPKYENEIKSIILFIQNHYSENIAINDIAKYANISRSECFRCFKRFTSKKPVEYINEYRLSCAANMLKNTDKIVTEICIECGFSNSSYFGKLFKKQYGVTPLKYRKQFC